MANDRQTYSRAVHVALTTQVDGRCPLCGKALLYKKGGKQQSAYELAHIYPLHPNLFELAELQGVERISEDVNDPDNLIPLCRNCHGRFDKPRTRQEYEYLLETKREALRRIQQQDLQAEYSLEADIRSIITGLQQEAALTVSVALSYDLKKMAEKFNPTMPVPTRQKIKHAVWDYYRFIKSSFLEMEREAPTSSELISTQVKAFYLKQKSLGLDQQSVFANVAEWIRVKTQTASVEAAEIVAAYFIQNCEVFE